MAFLQILVILLSSLRQEPIALDHVMFSEYPAGRKGFFSSPSLFKKDLMKWRNCLIVYVSDFLAISIIFFLISFFYQSHAKEK